jgi:arginine decarboxylase
LKKTHYQNDYTLAFPLKVNPHVSVAKTMAESGNVLFEVGNKAELIIALTHAKHEQHILCNGFKDEHYLSLILKAAKAGQKIVLIFETLEELQQLVHLTPSLPTNFCLGMRMRLSTPIAGHWEDSNGKHSKFGLSSLEALHVVETLKNHDLLSHLKLLHAHPGSQILAIKELSSCFNECVRYYHELLKLGAPIEIVDIGGGLAMDYSGEHKGNLRDYTLDDYALAIIKPMEQYCRKHHLPQPRILSETGRHTLALSSMLLTDIHPLGQQEILPAPQPELRCIFIRQLWELHQFIVGFHNSEHAEAVHTQQDFLLENIQKQFRDNKLSLAELAWAEKICAHNQILLAGPSGYQKYLANFSLFQSLPDNWGINQFFPMLSLHGYQHELTRSAVLYDLTCDSDGVVKKYLHPNGPQSHLTLPDCPVKFVGIFLIGAYQEIMASGHNLFERLPCLEITWNTDESGKRDIETHLYPGCDIADSLSAIGYDEADLIRKSRKKFKKSVIEKHLTELNYMRGKT